MIDSQSGKTGSDTKAAVRAACGPLLEILEDETVSVIHHSFTEFLIDAGRISRTAIADTHPQFPVIDPMATHGSLALTCLRYLSSGCLKGLILSDRPREGINHRSAVQNAQELKLKYPFLEYAMHNFYIHARKCGVDDLLVSQLDAFMTNNEQAFHAWLNLCWPGQSKSSLLSPLHAAAMAGMANYVQHLLQSGADGNARDGEQKTPLSWASAKGHADVVAVLLANVEDPDVDDEQGLKPLHYAAQGNHYQVVRLLLKAGVSPLTGKTKDYGRRCGNSPSSIGHNPLKYASEAGSVESIREMVPYLEPKDLNNALVWATKEGKALVVELLLTLPDCSPDPPGQPNSPLFLAAAGLHFDIMRALLSSGAIPDKLSDNPDSGMRFLNIEDMLEQVKSGSTPLHALCGGSKQRFRRSNDENAEKCFGLLLQAGCNLDAVDKEGKTPLHHSIAHSTERQYYGSLPMVLLKAGASHTVKDLSGNTPLHLLHLHNECGPLLKLLASRGADFNARRLSDGRTPLHCILESIHGLDIKLLLPYVKEWNAADSRGDTALHIYLSKFYQPGECLQDLLDAGANVHARNKKGETPLHVARELAKVRLWSAEKQRALFGISTSRSQVDEFAVAPNTTNQIQTGGLFGSAKSQPQAGGIFGTATAQPPAVGLGVLAQAQQLHQSTALSGTLDTQSVKGGMLEATAGKPAPQQPGGLFTQQGGLFASMFGGGMPSTVQDTAIGDEQTLLAVLLAAGADLEARDYTGRTILYRLFAKRAQTNEPDVRLLLDHGARCDVYDNEGNSILHQICINKPDVAMMKYMIKAGVDLHAVNHAGDNLLHTLLTSCHGEGKGLLDVIDMLLNSDISPAAKNTIGRTPFHLACSAWRRGSPEFLFRSALGASIDAEDNHGIRPIHLAATMSEDIVASLIKHGADTEAITHEDMNLLHIAAKARESNTLGMLIEHCAASGFSDMINAADEYGRTPLHYACRSGRPESVALLLQAGANVKLLDKKMLTPLHACAEFEEENLLWAISPKEKPIACGILTSDVSRPVKGSHWNHFGNAYANSVWKTVSQGDPTARIRETIRLLVQHGAEIAFAGRLSSPIDLAVTYGCTEMVDELFPLMEPIYAQAKEEKRGFGQPGTQRNRNFQVRQLVDACRSHITKEDLVRDGNDAYLCNSLLATKKHATIEQLPALGVDFANPRLQAEFLTLLATCGYAHLFERLGATIKTVGWINGIFDADNHSQIVEPYIMSAASSPLPNMDMLKIAVEMFGADVNVRPEVRQRSKEGGDQYVPGQSTMHLLAAGDHWWHVGALEYLLQYGANPELRDDKGKSVLNHAVSFESYRSLHMTRAITKLLLEHGANPNIVDTSGQSCLNAAMHDLELVRLLIEHGADISKGKKSVLLSAIAAQDVAAVSMILEAGADCNVRQPPDMSELTNLELHTDAIRESEHYPLHLAASATFNTSEHRHTAIQIIKLLLDHGADPLLEYRKGQCILHHIFLAGGTLAPFLQSDSINFEHRDASGQTVLLAACRSRFGTDTTARRAMFGHRSTFQNTSKTQKWEVDDPLPCLVLYNRGVDLLAVDYDGNNALHLLLTSSRHNTKDFEKAFDTFVQSAPSLVNQKNSNGYTPLHVALGKHRMWIVERLMDAGAGTEADPLGNTPLHHIAHAAFHCNNPQDPTSRSKWYLWLKKFLDLGVPINEKNHLGETLLFNYFAKGPTCSTIQQQKEIFISFLEADADLLTINNEGETLMHAVAKRMQHRAINNPVNGLRIRAPAFAFLMSMGLDPMAEDKSQRTALDVAAAVGNDAVLALFKRDKVVLPPKGRALDLDDDW